MGNEALEIPVWSENTGSGTEADPNDIEYLSREEHEAIVAGLKLEYMKALIELDTICPNQLEKSGHYGLASVVRSANQTLAKLKGGS